VVGEAPLVQTTTSDVGQVITEKLVQKHPDERAPLQDLSLLGARHAAVELLRPHQDRGGGISYGGMTGERDHQPSRRRQQRRRGARDPPAVHADAIQEYKVTTQRYSAEFGRSWAASSTSFTKSGNERLQGHRVPLRARPD